MTKRPSIKTTSKEIAEYWDKNIDETELSIDFSEALERCWRCGYKSKLQRCHIIPHALGGIDSPENMVLLCGRCHVEAPNIKDIEFFWEWLKAQSLDHYGIYDTYWTIRGFKEYEVVYKETFKESLEKVSFNFDKLTFEEFLKNQMKFVTIHFGQGRLNPSTIAGIMRSFIKQQKNYRLIL